MSLQSDYRPLGPVDLPYRGRQLYMHSFDVNNPTVPVGYEDYLPLVTDLVHRAGVLSGMAHMTVDEKVVLAGTSQRRPGPHVDGCYIPERSKWGRGGGSGGWLHYCNNISGADSIQRMAVIVAASAVGCKAWRGTFDANPDVDGDLGVLLPQLDQGEVLPANAAYLLSPDCVHESLRLDCDTKRTFLRIALPISFRFVQ